MKYAKSYGVFLFIVCDAGRLPRGLPELHLRLQKIPLLFSTGEERHLSKKNIKKY